MKVKAIEVLDVGSRRGRICVRPDGLFHFVTEHLRQDAELDTEYWTNDHPPSGIIGSKEEATVLLQKELGSNELPSPTEVCKIDLGRGPWPDPEVTGVLG